jgi:hypothetical protein
MDIKTDTSRYEYIESASLLFGAVKIQLRFAPARARREKWKRDSALFFSTDVGMQDLTLFYSKEKYKCQSKDLAPCLPKLFFTAKGAKINLSHFFAL